MIVVMMSLMLVSCGGDDSDDGSRGNELVTKAVGTWMCTSSTDSARGASVDGLMVGKQITINNNGTYTEVNPESCVQLSGFTSSLCAQYLHIFVK